MGYVERNFAGDAYAQSGYWGPQTSVAKYAFPKLIHAYHVLTFLLHKLL